MFRLSYELVLPWLSLTPYLSGTPAVGFQTPRLSYRTRELGVGLMLSRATDFEWFTLRGGLAAEALWLTQSEAEAREPTRSTFAGAFALQVGLQSPPFLGDFVVSLIGEAALYAYRSTAAAFEPTSAVELSTRPTYRAFLALGYEL